MELRFLESSERGSSRSASSGVLARCETDIQVSTNTALCTSLLYLTFDFVILCLLSANLYFLRSADFQISQSTGLGILILTDDMFDFDSEGKILIFKHQANICDGFDICVRICIKFCREASLMFPVYTDTHSKQPVVKCFRL